MNLLLENTINTLDGPSGRTTTPTVWSIAGSDSSGCAGVQNDIKTVHALGGHCCSIVTAVTAQNAKRVHQIQATSPDAVQSQITALNETLQPQAIKLGMLGNAANIRVINQALSSYNGPIVVDPVLKSTSGQPLLETDTLDALKNTLSLATVITPNIEEAELLSGITIDSHADIEAAAKVLLTLGCKAVVIKGGHNDGDWALDFCLFSNEFNNTQFWLATPKWKSDDVEKNTSTHHFNVRGTGCTFSSALATALAHGYCLYDALTIAKAYVSQGIRLATEIEPETHTIQHLAWPCDSLDLPRLIDNPALLEDSTPFPACETQQLGLYPIVDSLEMLTTLLQNDVKTIQLRVKGLEDDALEELVAAAIATAKEFDARLFINDYWQLAIKYQAYGVHLGQEDLSTADLNAIKAAALKLGVSTHCYFEVARAHGVSPSYIAYGPVFETFLKKMPFCPRGVNALQYWVSMLKDYPMVAIGGITEARAPEIVSTGVGSFAVVSAITKADDPIAATRRLSSLYNS